MSMAKVLAENGHNVTVVTSLKPHVTHRNLNHIYVPLTEKEHAAHEASIANMTERDNSNMFRALFHMRKEIYIANNINFNVMKNQRVRDLYENKDNKFDLVMVGFCFNNFQIGIAQKLKVPVVVATSMFPSKIFDPMLGDIQTQSYVPSMFLSMGKGQVMSLLQRIKNYQTISMIEIIRYLIDIDNANYYQQLYGDDPTMPKYEELNKNVSLVLFNSHSLSEGPIRPNFPGAIEVGGIQIKEKPDPLPKPIADFLQNAEKMVKDGFGLSMSLLTLEEKPFHDNIKEVLDNPKYTEKVKAFSQLFRDRPLTARQTVLYWVEYVLRHHGAAHLQSPLVHMSFIEANNLDIYALLIFFIAVVWVLFKLVFKFLNHFKPNSDY
ncbi:putative UDP-glucuronosyltransferase ugt-50 [Drosophila navojoa]|uniref:putative UDP-glucuronosyltransferase ugt-50 n=1 Tax=Drosophila navojoa TaxID=7232 RepID=UPI0011BDF291|nr:putative UDP-glucuronosyltransferase ugt-50 [Drosophila navojoa]